MLLSKATTPLPPLPTTTSSPRVSSPLRPAYQPRQPQDETPPTQPTAQTSTHPTDEHDADDDTLARYSTYSNASATAAAAVPSASLIPPGKAQSYTAIFEDALEQLAVLADIAGVGGGGNAGGDASGGGGGAQGGQAGAGGLAKSGEARPSGGRTLQDQRALEDRYEQLLGEQNTFRQHRAGQSRGGKDGGGGGIGGGGSAAGGHDLTTEQGRNSQAAASKSHANSARNQAKIQQERSTLQALIGKTARELRDYRFGSLVVTVEEEYKKRNTLQETIDREREASHTLKSLQKELASEKRRLEDETSDRNQVIQQLKDTIQEINVLTNSEQKYIKKETKAHETSVRQRCAWDELQLAEERTTLGKRLEQERKAHEKIVDFLTRQRETMEKQIQDWMGKYEEDTEAKVGELEAFKQKRSSDLDRFEELLAAYEELEKVVEEDRQLKQVEADRVREEKLAAQAATKIQRWYKRKLEARKELAKQVKSAKGKKGGKKGAKAAAPASAKAKTPGTPKK
ncbi:hypothetical protein HDU87_006436 [Geranomyces variabilis]|uniref:Dynein regulatory complex protein 9 n=1 Tax=Geranomyces variabilis TaxID=109894 RepID=A0AAD5TKY2_9FUNG|nr:hypothetical protein HDU87_006436 [Geranomyces variabilis]